jgi:hypothetical protein
MGLHEDNLVVLLAIALSQGSTGHGLSSCHLHYISLIRPAPRGRDLRCILKVGSQRF